MTIPRSELFDFSSHPIIRQAMQNYMTFGSIVDFGSFIAELDRLIKENEKLRGKECQGEFSMSGESARL